MKKKSFLGILLFTLALVIIFSSYILYLRNSVVRHPFKSQSGKVQFTVKNEENLNNVIENLQKQDNIKGVYFIKSFIQKNNVKLEVKPGEYSFSSNISLDQVIRYLNKGIKDDQPIKIVIPEGYDVEHIASALEKKGIISKDEFIKSCREYKLPSFIVTETKRKYALEGYLFPDTYELLKGTEGKEIIDVMIKRFSTVINDIEKETGKNIKSEELDKIVTMASIVEKEVERQDERGKAASVFYNRLQKGMKLQSCATVLYALGVHKDKLYYNDLKVNSPYNTYIVSGLPIGPISNPGRDCIKAALNPDNTNYLFFVSKNDGTHFFTDSEKKFLEVKKVTQGD